MGNKSLSLRLRRLRDQKSEERAIVLRVGAEQPHLLVCMLDPESVLLLDLEDALATVVVGAYIRDVALARLGPGDLSGQAIPLPSISSRMSVQPWLARWFTRAWTMLS